VSDIDRPRVDGSRRQAVRFATGLANAEHLSATDRVQMQEPMVLIRSLGVVCIGASPFGRMARMGGDVLA